MYPALAGLTLYAAVLLCHCLLAAQAGEPGRWSHCCYASFLQPVLWPQVTPYGSIRPGTIGSVFGWCYGPKPRPTALSGRVSGIYGSIRPGIKARSSADVLAPATPYSSIRLGIYGSFRPGPYCSIFRCSWTPCLH